MTRGGGGVAVTALRVAWLCLALGVAAPGLAQPQGAKDAFYKGIIEGKSGLYQKAVAYFDEAVRIAREACELTQWKEPSYLDPLAAAYARSGDFASAVKWQIKALEDPDFRETREVREPFALYRAGKAYPPN